jgi:Cdc6-like AAA superfamily ATPase
MPEPAVVYIYGPPGCGKTRMLEDIFSKTNGMVYRGTVRVYIWDGASYSSFSNLSSMPDCDYFVITSNLQPDDIPINMHHI